MDYSLKRKMEELGLYELGMRTTLDKVNANAPDQSNAVDKSHLRLLQTKIAGTSFIEDRSVFDEIQIGDVLFLNREPSNPHDPMAIAICNSSNKKLGYVPQDENTVIGNMLDAGKSIHASILDVIDHHRYLDISIEVYMDEEVSS